ncbi:MAG TPA: type II toxin-antitoxin system RelE/ParE family toxin [Cellvibrionaceae bacterium]|nr:type II toxin-antitoxin system RelE/ParE family toxin [Cellvibrionaceae bacterium]
MTQLLWHPQAVTDRQAIVQMLAEDSVEIANRWDKDLEAKLNQYASQPATLPAGRVAGTLELVLLPHFVLVAKAPTEKQPLTVLRILHTSKTWPQTDSFGT